MLERLKSFFSFGKRREFDEKRIEEFEEAKQAALEKIFGPMDDMVDHAIIPFSMGGGLDLYYFSKHIPGTVVASMELIGPDGKGPRRNSLGVFELVMCTHLVRPSSEQIKEEEKQKTPSAFTKQAGRMWSIMTSVAIYAQETRLDPGDTCEIPTGEDDDDRCFLVLDEFDTGGVPFEIEGKRYGLLLCIEVFPVEMEYARKRGTQTLLAKLKEAGVYPYTDLDRPPVV